jgi:branched-chain amino acid transport system permease protein
LATAKSTRAQQTLPAASPKFDLVGGLREAGIAALIAFVLAIPLLSERTVQEAGGLVLVSRWWLAFAAAGLVFAGRLALNLFLQSGRDARDGLSAAISRNTAWLGDTSRFLAPGMLAFAVILPIFPFSDRYIMDLSVLVLTYVMLGWGLNIVVGQAGLLDLGYVAFYAVGAYAYAIIAVHFDLSFWVCMPIAGAIAAMWGIILGFPVLRLRGDYLAIVTLAFGEIIRIVLLNWTDLTNGPNGISGIPRPTLFGLEFKAFGDNTFADFFGLTYSPLQRIVFLYYVILALALLTCVVTIRLRQLPVGRAWEALREDEIACRSLGINTTNTKLTAFAIGAMFGGIAGSFFATRQGFISPESFTFIESAIILAIVVLGGLGSQVGVAIAAIVLIGGFELFRELELYRMLIFGLAMVLIMVWRPRGLIATRSPSVVLKDRKTIGADLVGEGR